MPISLKEDNAVALVIQTNNGLNNANSYASVVELNNYADTRGITLTGNAEQLLLIAMDTIESKRYKGEQFKADQSTAFPVKGVGIPKNIKTAQIMLAVAADTALPVTDTPTAQVKSEAVDVIKVEYFENNNAKSALFDMVDDLLKPYLAGLSMGVNFKVYRG